MPEQPAVLVDQAVAQEVANTVMGGSASPDEVAVVQESAADSFEMHVGEGKTREEAASLVDEEMRKLMLGKFSPEELEKLEEQARANAAEQVVFRMKEKAASMEDDRRLYNQILRSQLEGGPEVNSHGMTVANPEHFASADRPAA